MLICRKPLLAAFVAASAFALAPSPMAAQSGSSSRTQGYPVDSDAVVRACGSCHTRDAAGRMTRISYLRKTPEGWQESIRRMVSLNGVQMDGTAAREVLRYLSDRQGLAPEELRPGRWEVERGTEDFTFTGDKVAGATCSGCHSLGRVITQRRTTDEWKLLVHTHRGLYPLVDRQLFYERGVNHKGPQPVDAAVDYFAKIYPLETPEWAAWSANLRPPRLEGTWALSGHDPARGPLEGRMTVRAISGRPGEFLTETTYIYPEGGARITRMGQSLVYTGYQWRGRSTSGGNAGELREVMMVERSLSEMSGRWFTGANDETGIEVKLTKSVGAPIITGVFPVALKVGSTGTQVRIFGEGLGSLDAADVDLGPGVRVTQIARSSAQEVVVRVDVAGSAPVGARDVVVPGTTKATALAIHDGVDRVAIRPLAGMARVGGAVFPKQFQQFEAVGYADGADGKPNTADDVFLGRVPVSWSVEEYPVTYDDDDIKFSGTIDQNGLFTPALDGPNPERSLNRNNVGDLWVVATLAPAEAGGKTVRARAQLIVTVPLYLRWDPWTGGTAPRPVSEAAEMAR